MKTNQFIFAAFTAAFLSVASFSAAQVTIGGGDQPAAGAVLDLNSTTKGGLLLSNVSIVDLGQIPENAPNVFPGISGATTEQKQALAGMIVWNTNDYLIPNGDGLYLWDGNKWNYIGGSNGQALPPPPVPISAPSCLSLELNVTFSHYNLGVDTTKFNSGEYATLSPAKQQIRYLVDCTLDEAVNVWGDLYQWGRIADGHEKRNSQRYPNDNDTEQNGAISSVDENGQPKTSGKGKFIKQTDAPQNWCTPTKNDLWGNGMEMLTGQNDNQGGIYFNGKYHQNTNWTMPQNDPCPTGWRVPTQDEWERLGNYDCKPNTANGSIGDMTANGLTTTTRGTNNELTWIPVRGGKVTNSGWGYTKNKFGGYAIYKASDWTAATTEASGYFYNVIWSSTDKRLYDAAAPEPLLFLPAAGWRYRSNGVVNHNLASDNIYGGFYWSSTRVIYDYAYILGFRNSTLFLPPTAYRSMGLSVRCVKE
ncbi:MAG: fibrobacter succinogenes major paralogous domain-containing protein [Prevotellaceae bacterium]|jgi:hypothetical protein|nr:fibrobacter succinogenes major paralogous domain-containing protein [Prevotellaceae bacterium]